MSGLDSWDPAQYNRFAAEREQPFWDLTRLLEPVETPRTVDLGCGDGRLTALLHRDRGASGTLGVDSSPAMVSAAAAQATGTVRFELGDIGLWERPGEYDIVFANASLQWVADHRRVLAGWAASLRAGGQLAVQVPANADHPAHLMAAELGAEMIEDPPPDPVARNVLAPEAYAALLDELGFDRQHVRLQVYAHHLPSTADVVEWVKGSTLTRFKEPLGTDGWQEFVDRYRSRLLAVLGDRSSFFYPFKRILLWGRRS
ncbi:MAG: methyltransferase domain-containing protein [Acidimicrobiales bacterium]